MYLATIMNNSHARSSIRVTPDCSSATDSMAAQQKKASPVSSVCGELKRNEAFPRIGPESRNQPWLLEKWWKTSAQDALTTRPTSALGQHRTSSHSVVQPAETEEPELRGLS